MSTGFDITIAEDELDPNSAPPLPDFSDDFASYISYPQLPMVVLSPPAPSPDGVVIDLDGLGLPAPNPTYHPEYLGSPSNLEPADFAVSSAFPFGFMYEGHHSDIILVSSDSVYFCVGSEKLFSESTNCFGGIFPEVPIGFVRMPLESSVLNVLLHAVYDFSPVRYAPSVADITSAVDAMNRHGISPAKTVSPDSTLFQVLMQHALASPIQCYALAASAELEELAVSVSSYTLSIPIRDLPEDILLRMGSKYLIRLISLHLNRVDALKTLVFPPPACYGPIRTCNLVAQRALFHSWIMAVASLCWDPQPDLATSSIVAALRPLSRKLTCDECYQRMDRRIHKLVVDWALVGRTI